MPDVPPTAALELASSKATETLSQFVARVLNQLSLSAWLPSAALVLSSTFVIALGQVLDAKDAPSGWAAVTSALGKLSNIGVGGGLLLFSAVVVLTTITQAFSFEAIRFLEGYWGTSGIAESLADRRAKHFAKRAETLAARYDKLTWRAWEGARGAIEAEQARASGANEVDNEALEWSNDQLAYLGARLRKLQPNVTLPPAGRVAALSIPWERFAAPELIRRRVSVDKKRRDFPAQSRSLPTRLGNVLRAYEDRTGRVNVETAVLEIYDDLPLGARTRHDEHRNRLDLYASLLFVDVLVTALALARFLPSAEWAAAIGAVIVGATISALIYRAAIASARIYGILLVDIVLRHPSPDRATTG